VAKYDGEPGFFIDDLASEAYGIDLAVTLADLPDSPSTLELGCGSGGFTKWLYARGMHVVGIDSSEAQLAEAREQFPDGDFHQYSIENGSEVDRFASAYDPFDLLITRYVIHELADPIETFSLWKKLLKPTGKLVLIENAWIRTDWGENDWGKRTNSLPLACTQTWATAAYCLKKAGYSVVESRWMTTLNALEPMATHDFRLYCISAELPK
jgi:SAM-dependent methyltransferase